MIHVTLHLQTTGRIPSLAARQDQPANVSRLPLSSPASFSHILFMFRHRRRLAEQSVASSSTAGEGALGVRTSAPLPQPARQPKPWISRNPKNFLAPSSLRPLVLASDQATSWQTPYSIRNQQLLLTCFPPEQITRFHEVCASSVTRRTREG